jgi:hypothetical protein
MAWRFLRRIVAKLATTGTSMIPVSTWFTRLTCFVRWLSQQSPELSCTSCNIASILMTRWGILRGGE